MPLSNPNWVAGGDINPSRFVTPKGTTNGFTVKEADANELIVGISQEGARDAPIPSASTLAAATGENIHVYGPGEVCMLQMGATCNAGALLKSDADGKGTPVTSNNDKYGAIALQDATASTDIIPVFVTLGFYGA